jgi:biotin carboxyl carrier protein
VLVDGTSYRVDVEEGPDGRPRVRVDGRPVAVDARLPAAATGSLLVDGASHQVDMVEERGGWRVWIDGEAFQARVEGAARRRGRVGGVAAGTGQRLLAPMPGKVVAVLVEVGQAVEAGTGLVILEAMKMENEFRAGVAGIVTEVHVAAGEAVDAGDLLVVIG